MNDDLAKIEMKPEWVELLGLSPTTKAMNVPGGMMLMVQDPESGLGLEFVPKVSVTSKGILQHYYGGSE
jgi:hypothetical protein